MFFHLYAILITIKIREYHKFLSMLDISIYHNLRLHWDKGIFESAKFLAKSLPT